MSKRERERKQQKLDERRAALRELRAQRNLYRVAFPWKKLIWAVGSTVMIVLLVWLVPRGIVWASSLSKVSGPFGEISRKELNNSKFATIVTNQGDIKVELLNTISPKTVANFVLLAKKDFYDGVKFHRVIKDFMIQTGDPLSKDADPANDGTGGPGYTFADEISEDSPKLVRGIVAMANSGVDTNGSQFFIVTKEAVDWLDGKHTPFGQVVYGMDIVDKIGNTPTDAANDRPKQDIIVKDIIISTS
ncbi:MAG: peptidylprolyl isomerase [Patescibacteria group bacterium]|jgi:cyclophilin family peptidyl-prolyl cis-trans isomerase